MSTHPTRLSAGSTVGTTMAPSSSSSSSSLSSNPLASATSNPSSSSQPGQTASIGGAARVASAAATAALAARTAALARTTLQPSVFGGIPLPGLAAQPVYTPMLSPPTSRTPPRSTLAYQLSASPFSVTPAQPVLSTITPEELEAASRLRSEVVAQASRITAQQLMLAVQSERASTDRLEKELEDARAWNETRRSELLSEQEEAKALAKQSRKRKSAEFQARLKAAKSASESDGDHAAEELEAMDVVPSPPRGSTHRPRARHSRESRGHAERYGGRPEDYPMGGTTVAAGSPSSGDTSSSDSSEGGSIRSSRPPSSGGPDSSSTDSDDTSSSDSSSGSSRGSGRRRRRRGASRTIRTLPPIRINEYDGEGGTKVLRDWIWEVSRQVRYQGLHTSRQGDFKQIESIATSCFGRKTYDWYWREKRVRRRSRLPRSFINTWDRFKEVLELQYNSMHETQLALDEWYHKAMDVASGEDVMTYMNRIIDFRERLTSDTIPPLTFLDRLTRSVHAGYPSLYHDFKKYLKKKARRGGPPTLHELRHKLADISRDTVAKAIDAAPPTKGQGRHQQQHGKPASLHAMDASSSMPAAAAAALAAGPSSSDTSSLQAQLSAMKAKCVKAEQTLGAERKGQAPPTNRRSKGAKAKQPKATVNALRVDNGGGTGDKPERRRINYTDDEVSKLYAMNICFNCGGDDHIRRFCTKATVDLHSRLKN